MNVYTHAICHRLCKRHSFTSGTTDPAHHSGRAVPHVSYVGACERRLVSTSRHLARFWALKKLDALLLPLRFLCVSTTKKGDTDQQEKQRQKVDASNYRVTP